MPVKSGIAHPPDSILPHYNYTVSGCFRGMLIFEVSLQVTKISTHKFCDRLVRDRIATNHKNYF